MNRQQLLQGIYEDMELVTQHKCSSCELRLYLSSVSKFNEFEKFLAEKCNQDEEITISELEDMLQDADNILKNLGIQKQKEQKMARE